MKEKLKVFEAFAGVGTQHMALKRLGIDFEIVGISEIDEYAIMSYEAIHGKVNNLGDISLLNPEDVPDHDLFTYSFPCQDVSLDGFGRGIGEGTRSGLLYECIKIIEAKKPKYLLLENVKNLVNRFKGDFDKWLEWLSSQGYKNYWKVLNAKDFSNIPQNRERVYVVSILDSEEEFVFPDNIPLTKTLYQMIDFEDEDPKYLDEEMIAPIVYRDFKSDTQRAFIVNTKKGYDIASVGDSFVYTYITSKTRRGRIGRGVAQTLQTVITMGIVMDDLRIKKLSSLEAWRLMGISDEDYHKAKNAGVSHKQLHKQAGMLLL